MVMKDLQVAIIGLGYIGLPLAISLSKFFRTTGYDLNQKRINELRNGIDRTEEISKSEIKSKKNLVFTSNIQDIKNANFYIIAVQSPIGKNKNPDFRPLIKVCEDLSKIIKKNDICVFESTVYPGATEEVLIPIIEKKTNYKFNSDFFVGYSPERINPGDKIRSLENITKVISGSDKKTTKVIYNVYRKIINAGLHVASSIKVAEASKVVENVQRDLNIALINELSMIFNKMKINTREVLDASSTKWNFTKYEPGLVGGHCIGVDPYYLTYKSKKLGLFPNVILSGRKINDKMHEFIGNKFIKNFSTKYNRFFTSEHYLIAKDRSLKMMDRIDDMSIMSRLDREAVFNMTVIWTLSRFEKTLPDALISVENPHTHIHYTILQICDFLNIPCLKFNAWTPLPILSLSNALNGKIINTKTNKH